jgi:segregation and condensation protein B
VEKFHRTTFKSHLTPSLLEVLAVIAYRQPVTRAQVEAIRGVKLSKALHLLLTLKLIRFVGKADAPGRPPLYGTTKEFLHYFGLNSLEDLPPLEHFSTL